MKWFGTTDSTVSRRSSYDADQNNTGLRLLDRQQDEDVLIPVDRRSSVGVDRSGRHSLAVIKPDRSLVWEFSDSLLPWLDPRPFKTRSAACARYLTPAKALIQNDDTNPT